MEFDLDLKNKPKWPVFFAFVLLVFSFVAGARNSILFYEFLPHDIPKKGIVVFYQPTCLYCIAEVPVIRKLVENGYPVHSVNVLRHPDISARYGINATPTILILPSGIRLIGEQPYESIVKAYEAGINYGQGEACGVKTYTCGVT